MDSLPHTVAELLAAAAGAAAIAVDPAERKHSIPAPRAYADEGEDHIDVAASTRIALWLEHRSHLQQANLEMLGATFLRSMGRPKLLLGLRYLFERWRPGARRLFSRIAAGCKIHPTAIIEASSIGPGCEIGAYAIVRASVLGEGVAIEDGAHVQMACLGSGARIARQTSVFASVLMEGAHSAQAVMQMSVLGRHSATTSASWFVDVRLEGNVRVESSGAGLLDSGTRFLGCDMGHASFLGAGVTVAAGRMLPSNAKIIADPKSSLSTLGSVDPMDGGGRIFVVKGGSLEPLR
jgi:carbonic anhydrase/acetyltransferase-like protein (isoleucine patch superfamily)